MRMHVCAVMVMLGFVGSAMADIGDFGQYIAKAYPSSGSGGHAVWFSSGQTVFGGSGNQSYYFVGNAGSFSYQANSAVLSGTIYNTSNPSQQFKLRFSYTTSGVLPLASLMPKLGGTTNNTAWARANWDFYNLDVSDSYIRDLSDNDLVELRQLPTNGTKPFQVGFGANDKGDALGDFGASGWFEFRTILGEESYGAWKQGDVNIDLMMAPTTQIPSPAAALLGFIGLPLVALRRRRAAD